MQGQAPFPVMIGDHQGVFADPGASRFHTAALQPVNVYPIDIQANASYYF
jgi:hypothetical protein